MKCRERRRRPPKEMKVCNQAQIDIMKRSFLHGDTLEYTAKAAGVSARTVTFYFARFRSEGLARGERGRYYGPDWIGKPG